MFCDTTFLLVTVTYVILSNVHVIVIYHIKFLITYVLYFYAHYGILLIIYGPHTILLSLRLKHLCT